MEHESRTEGWVIDGVVAMAEARERSGTHICVVPFQRHAWTRCWQCLEWIAVVGTHVLQFAAACGTWSR